MDFIKFSASMTMLELVRYLLQDSTNSFSFYSGKLSTCLENCQSKDSLLKEICHYICKKVREEWIVSNIGIISVDGELMICVTSPDPSMPAEVISFIVEAVAASTTISPQVLSNPSDEASDESMEEDIPPEMIQVNASMKEINERIEQFVRYKRAQANSNNVLEFCGPPTGADSCARVDAVLERKKDSSSHLAVRNVLDRYTSKCTTERLPATGNQRPIGTPLTSLNATKAQSVNTVLGSQGQQERQPTAVAPALKAQKRTYDVATLESMLMEVKKQQKT